MSIITIWDSVAALDVPRDRDAYAGYVDGEWRSYPELVRRVRRPAAVLSITVTGRVDADVGDVEHGDLSYPGAARWLTRMHGKGVLRPVLYTSLYAAVTLVPTLEQLGHHRSSYRLWLAHWTHEPHICGIQCDWHYERPGATQWTDRAPAPWHADLSRSTVGWVNAVLHERTRLHPRPDAA